MDLCRTYEVLEGFPYTKSSMKPPIRRTSQNVYGKMYPRDVETIGLLKFTIYYLLSNIPRVNKFG